MTLDEALTRPLDDFADRELFAAVKVIGAVKFEVRSGPAARTAQGRALMRTYIDRIDAIYVEEARRERDKSEARRRKAEQAQ